MLLQLPPEITVRILSYLDLTGLISASRTHPLLYKYVQTFQVLQYRFISQTARVEDNPHSTLVLGKRLQQLKSRENGWEQLNIDFSKSISVDYPISGIYDLMGGIYLLGDDNRRALHCCRLPSTPDDGISWSQINLDCIYIDVGFNVYEHDLIAIVTSQPHPTDIRRHAIQVRLLECSTGRPHPRASNPVLLVTDVRTGRPHVGIEIVGDHLALVIHHQRPTHRDDCFCVFDWKSGQRKLMLTNHGHPYASLTFLTHNIILLPRNSTGALDIWEIPSSLDAAPSPHPLYMLTLPTLSDNHFYLSLTCRGEPNPTGPEWPPPTSPRHGQPPFRTHSSDAIINLHIRTLTLTPQGFNTNVFSMYIARGALLAVCRRHMADPVIGSGYVYIAWDQWGPMATRWMDSSKIQTRWITTSAGTRCVLYRKPEHDDEDDEVDMDAELHGEDEHVPPLRVLDFNSFAVRKFAGRAGKEGDDSTSPGVHVEVVMEPSTLNHPAFSMPVVSGLPYVSFTPPGERFEGFDSMLMDEERLLGLRTDPETRKVVEIEVMHIGTSF